MRKTTLYSSIVIVIAVNLSVFVFFFSRQQPRVNCNVNSQSIKYEAITTTKNDKKMVGFLQMATGKYSESFIKRSHKSFVDHMFVGHNDTTDFRTIYFTDQKEMTNFPKAVYIHQRKLEWPFDTMNRNEVYLKNRHILEGFDYLIALDMDMAWRQHVEPDLILNDFVTLRHLAFGPKGKGDFEKRKASQAYSPKFSNCYYVMGGFFGGRKEKFFHALETLQSWRKIDQENGIVPKWHDESYMNRYVCEHYDIEQEEGITFLGLKFFRGESDKGIPSETMLLHLNKKHNQIRS